MRRASTGTRTRGLLSDGDFTRDGPDTGCPLNRATRRRDTDVDVEAGQTLVLGSEDDEPVLLEGLDAEVGGLAVLFFQAGDAEGLEKQVPVLDARLPEYADLAP